MYKSNEDCFYFLTSTCVKVCHRCFFFFYYHQKLFKGSSCTYRHSPLALTCNINCPSWLRGNCLDRACPLRHSSIKVNQTLFSSVIYFHFD